MNVQEELLSESDIKRTFPTFIGVGLFVAAFQYVTFYVLFEQFGYGYITSSSTSFTLTVLISYLLQKHVTFRTEKVRKSDKKKIVFFILFVLNSVWGLVLNGLIMSVGVEILNMSPYVAQCVSMVILAGYNFFVYRALLG